LKELGKNEIFLFGTKNIPNPRHAEASEVQKMMENGILKIPNG
jgi:hypothetical protein